MQGARPGASWNISDNLVTKTVSRPDGPFVGEPLHVEHSDGTLTTYIYALAGNAKTVTTDTEAPNSARIAVTDGVRTVTTLDEGGAWQTMSRMDIWPSQRAVPHAWLRQPAAPRRAEAQGRSQHPAQPGLRLWERFAAGWHHGRKRHGGIRPFDNLRTG